ncbi:MAG TPA: alkaline phosphatase family protein [Gemmatimonadales bacterium]|nr:alkaline phosphatase family protein [Gemmatimonadales bacterium]
MRDSYERILVLVIDGLRPDAITPVHMPNLTAFSERAWQPPVANTVRPSITVAALSSLGTGVTPETHRLIDPSLDSLARLRQQRPLPSELTRLGVRTSVVAGELVPSTRFLVGGLLKLGGVERLIASGTHPRRVAEAMAEELRASRGRRFVLGYVRDTDVAGHAWGWMSEAYLTAARAVDRGLGVLNDLAEEPGTLVIVTADHGGGGVLPCDHDHPHPINDAIPLLVGGLGVRTGMEASSPGASLLDVPPTVLSAFGGNPPAQWQGRVLSEAFEKVPAWIQASA